MAGAVLVLAGVGAVVLLAGGDPAPTVVGVPPGPGPATTATIASVVERGGSTSTAPASPRGVPPAPDPPPPPPPPGVPDGFGGVGAVVVAEGGADMAATAGGEPFARAREGLVLAGDGFSPDRRMVRVLHMCDARAWVRLDEIAAILPASGATVGAGTDFGDAVIVVDPGHGGPNIGATSPDGLLEKDVNVDIAARLRDLLASSHGVDWATGAVLAGGDVPAARSVVVTRSGAGADADYEAGLDFRAAVANALGAHAMVSIHNNAGWEVRTRRVGSEAYYQSQPQVAERSRRLAVLVVEELRRGFAGFEADWVGSREPGAKSRLSSGDGVTQYYGLLEAATVPSVIVEGAYLANGSEADLLRTPAFRQAYAEAVYRALVRFVTTDDAGTAPSHDPKVWDGFAGRGGAADDCEIPAQPGSD